MGTQGETFQYNILNNLIKGVIEPYAAPIWSSIINKVLLCQVTHIGTTTASIIHNRRHKNNSNTHPTYPSKHHADQIKNLGKSSTISSKK